MNSRSHLGWTFIKESVSQPGRHFILQAQMSEVLKLQCSCVSACLRSIGCSRSPDPFSMSSISLHKVVRKLSMSTILSRADRLLGSVITS